MNKDECPYRDPRDLVTVKMGITHCGGWKIITNCGAEKSKSGLACTRPVGHKGPHLAYSFTERKMDVWYSYADELTFRGEGI